MTAAKGQQHDLGEEGIEIPIGQINPDTLRNMVEEFVTREWGEMGDSRHTLEDKVRQVLGQLHNGTARVVFDLTTETWNIVASR